MLSDCSVRLWGASLIWTVTYIVICREIYWNSPHVTKIYVPFYLLRVILHRGEIYTSDSLTIRYTRSGNPLVTYPSGRQTSTVVAASVNSCEFVDWHNLESVQLENKKKKLFTFCLKCQSYPRKFCISVMPRKTATREPFSFSLEITKFFPLSCQKSSDY